MKPSTIVLCALFLLGFGWAGQNDYDYRCKQAHRMDKHETCRMIAAK